MCHMEHVHNGAQGSQNCRHRHMRLKEKEALQPELNILREKKIFDNSIETKVTSD